MNATIHQDSQAVPGLDESQTGGDGRLPEVPPAASLALAPDPLQVSGLIPPPSPPAFLQVLSVSIFICG